VTVCAGKWVGHAKLSSQRPGATLAEGGEILARDAKA
jgi:hypothetical protein